MCPGSSIWRLRSTLIGSVGGTLLLVISACLGSGQAGGGALDERRGKASYYGDRFAGKTTASGERFDPEKLTAAHPTLPFGTRVRVSRVGSASERSVVVRINDRGPFSDDRIIDLSQAAARELEMIEEGVVQVELEVLEGPSNEETGGGAPDAGW